MSLTEIAASPHAPAAPARRPQSGLRAVWALSQLPRRQFISRLAFIGFMVAIAIISIICFVNAVRWVGKPFPGFLMNERMVTGNVGQYHWPGTQAGLRFPDKIIAANGEPVTSRRDIERIIQATPIGESIRYTISRAGSLIELNIPAQRFDWLDLIMTFGVIFVSGIAYLLIGAIVFVVKPDTRPSWTFQLFCFFLGVYAVTAFDIQSTHWGFARLYFLVLAFVPPAAIHLSLVFPERTKFFERYPRAEIVPYVISAALITALEMLYPRPPFLIPYRLILGYLFLSALAIAGSSLYAFFRSASPLARQRAKVVLAGAAVAFPVPALAQYLSLFGGVPIQNNFLAIPMIAFPASIAYAIARHNLFDVDVYIKRALGYVLMTAIVGLGYLSAQTFLRTVVLDPIFGDQAEKIYPIVFAVLIVFFFNPINRKVQASVDRVFFRKKLDYKETISSVSNALTSMLNLDQIVTQVVHTLRKEMFVDTAGVIILEPKMGACRSLFVGDDSVGREGRQNDIPIAYDDPLLELIREEKSLITRYDLEEDARYRDVKVSCLQRFAAMSVSMAIPLTYQGHVTGLLAVGNKKSGHFYGREDIDLLHTMADQAAVAIQNATAHEEVIRYAEELAASLRRIQLLESIKTNLAKFVPKTVQQLIEESPEAPSFEKVESDVSVVFADITGYTRLSAEMELDDVNRLVERYFGAFLDEIVRYGGDVNETVGDGLMVIFRDPDPQAHARSAIQSALGIQRRTAEINAELRERSQPIEMHVGVNSGIASVGATKIEGAAGTRWTYTASGPTTNIAARLAALGEGGAVMLSEETRRRLGAGFEADDLGAQALKNVPHPVRVYRLKATEPPPVPVDRRPELRHDPRELVSWTVRLWIGEEKYEARAVDASIHGICMAGIPMALLEVGKSYRAEIWIPGGPEVACLVEVRNFTDRRIGMRTGEFLPLD